MKYGVKYYLLKPCNEKKIEEAVLEARKDCLKAKSQSETMMRQNGMLRTIRQDAMYHLLVTGIACREKETLRKKLEDLLEVYGQYLETGSACHLYLVYYLEWEHLDEMLKKLESIEAQRKIPLFFYGGYVTNTLLLLSDEGGHEELLRNCASKLSPLAEIAKEQYESLGDLLEKVVLRIRRYDTVYAIHDYKTLAISNAQGTLQYIHDICERIGSTEGEEEIEELLAIAKETSRPDVLQVLVNGFCTRMMALGALTMVEFTRFLCSMNQESNLEQLRKLTVEIICQGRDKRNDQGRNYGIVVEQVMAYVNAHLSECDLTLKKISEEHLYMNVDYVSRIFRKSTGKKFSQYLTEQCVKRAKELLINDDSSKIQYVAEQVGCGNNPQYFSQIFKKVEGMTPGKWVTQMKK